MGISTDGQQQVYPGLPGDDQEYIDLYGNSGAGKGIAGRILTETYRGYQFIQITIPTDCPQRNERMGWTGDAQAYTRTGTYNSDAQNFFRQWMVALRNDQGIGSATEAPGGIGSTVPTYNKADVTSFADGATWSAAVCQVPWQLYIQYGDKQIIEENFETMLTWLNGMDFYDFSEVYPHLSLKIQGLADWLAVDGSTPSQLVNNAIYIYMMEVTSIMADAIGEKEIALILKERHDLAKAEWNKAYVDPATGKTKNADGTGNMTSYSAIVPANTTATLYLPVTEAADSFKGATGVTFVKKTTHNNISVAEYELSSGSFTFVITSNGITVK